LERNLDFSLFAAPGNEKAPGAGHQGQSEQLLLCGDLFQIGAAQIDLAVARIEEHLLNAVPNEVEAVGKIE